MDDVNVVFNYLVLFGGRFPQAKTAITENHPLEFSEKQVGTLLLFALLVTITLLTIEIN